MTVDYGKCASFIGEILFQVNQAYIPLENKIPEKLHRVPDYQREEQKKSNNLREIMQRKRFSGNGDIINKIKMTMYINSEEI